MRYRYPATLVIEELEPRVAPTVIAGVGVGPDDIALGPIAPPKSDDSGVSDTPLTYAPDWAEPNQFFDSA